MRPPPRRSIRPASSSSSTTARTTAGGAEWRDQFTETDRRRAEQGDDPGSLRGLWLGRLAIIWRLLERAGETAAHDRGQNNYNVFGLGHQRRTPLQQTIR